MADRRIGGGEREPPASEKAETTSATDHRTGHRELFNQKSEKVSAISMTLRLGTPHDLSAESLSLDLHGPVSTDNAANVAKRKTAKPRTISSNENEGRSSPRATERERVPHVRGPVP